MIVNIKSTYDESPCYSSLE